MSFVTSAVSGTTWHSAFTVKVGPAVSQVLSLKSPKSSCFLISF